MQKRTIAGDMDQDECEIIYSSPMDESSDQPKNLQGSVEDIDPNTEEMENLSGIPMKPMFPILDDDNSCNPPNPVVVHPSLVKPLKEHQIEGIQFLYRYIFGSTDFINNDGVILAHCMGLGKTLTVIAFLHTVMLHSKISQHAKRVLVVAPKNVVTNWGAEFRKWITTEPELNRVNVRELNETKDVYTRFIDVEEWAKSKNPSVLIISYNMLRTLIETDEDTTKKKHAEIDKTVSAKTRKDLKEGFRKYLQNPGPDIVVCDEAHQLRNETTSIFKVMTKIATRRRICMTGTPMQNNLIEYHTMINFVKPGFLGHKKEFSARFEEVIKLGQTKNANNDEVNHMKKQCHILTYSLRSIVHRKDYQLLVKDLARKDEYVIFVRLTDRQKQLYEEFRNICFRNDRTLLSKTLLSNYHIFARIWTHPYLLKERDQQDEDIVLDKDGSDAGGDSDNDDAVVEQVKKRTSGSAGAARMLSNSEAYSGFKKFYTGFISENDENDWSLSNKLLLLQQILKQCERCGDKVLIFSQSLGSLKLIRRMLERLNEQNLWFVDGHIAKNSEGQRWGWERNKDYYVIDGNVTSKNRSEFQRTFEDSDNLRGRLVLFSTKAGALGTNFVAANRVVIFDACWNPAHDNQAIFRAYRYGQQKPVFVYRLVAQGTMEHAIFNRQVTKESVARRVMDEAQIERHFDGHDLDELYEYDPKDSVTHLLKQPTDSVLAAIFASHGMLTESFKYHDAFFEDMEEEKLSVEELAEARRIAELDKEREKLAKAGDDGFDNSAHLKKEKIDDILVGAKSDLLYTLCSQVREMDDSMAVKIIFIKNALEFIYPNIPKEARGPLQSFSSLFFAMLYETVSKNENAERLLQHAIQSFKITINCVGNVAECEKAIDQIRSVTFDNLEELLFEDA